MSNARIRALLNEKLISGLDNGDELAYPVALNGAQSDAITDTHILAHLIPSPVINGTLGGDHKGFIGIYQMTIKGSNNYQVGDPVDDRNEIIDEVLEKLQEVFPINTRIGDESEFVVQVLTSISVSEATCERNDSWWQAHAYFTYRADTN